jgi:hypothetical protein
VLAEWIDARDAIERLEFVMDVVLREERIAEVDDEVSVRDG